jgi:hypothetical protein
MQSNEHKQNKIPAVFWWIQNHFDKHFLISEMISMQILPPWGDFKVRVNTGVLCTFCTVNTGAKTKFEITPWQVRSAANHVIRESIEDRAECLKRIIQRFPNTFLFQAMSCQAGSRQKNWHQWNSHYSNSRNVPDSFPTDHCIVNTDTSVLHVTSHLSDLFPSSWQFIPESFRECIGKVFGIWWISCTTIKRDKCISIYLHPAKISAETFHVSFLRIVIRHLVVFLPCTEIKPDLILVFVALKGE